MILPKWVYHTTIEDVLKNVSCAFDKKPLVLRAKQHPI